MAVKEAIILILDIGLSAAKDVCSGGSTFLEMSKLCMARIIERKLFSAPKDEISIVLLGTEESVNGLEYDNISEGFPLSCPSWDMLRALEKVEGTDVKNADWIDALVVAMDIIQNQQGKKFTAKKIVLFSNLDSNVNDDKLDVIISGIQNLGIELTAIGVHLCPEIKTECDSDTEANDTSHQNGHVANDKQTDKQSSAAILSKILKEIGGVSCSFEDAIPQLLFHQAKAVRAAPWNVCLEIGPDIKIPITGFKKISEVTLPTWGTGMEKKNTPGAEARPAESTKNNPVIAETEVSYFREDQTSITREELVPAYHFGSSLVPFTDDDKETMNYQSGERCLSVLGFAYQSDVPRNLLSGDGVYYFVAPKDCPEAHPPLSALIKTLHYQKKLAIVRKVYNKGNLPCLCAMFPLIKEEFNCLLLIEIPYSEEVNEYIFPPVVSSREKPNAEELNVIDQFIDNMDLMNVEEDDEFDEALHPENIISPELAHAYRCIAHRALHPDDTLPPVADEIKNMLKGPFDEKGSFKDALFAVKMKYELIPQERELAKRKRKEKNDSNIDDGAGVVEPIIPAVTDLSDLTKDSVVEVGTSKPEEDFLTLLDKGASFREVCLQMQRVLLGLVLRSFGSDDFPKARAALKTLRTKCAEKEPKIYNDWLPSFKTDIHDRDREAFWDIVVMDGLGLITVQENSASAISPEAASDFLKVEQPEPAENEMELDADDLLNEM